MFILCLEIHWGTLGLDVTVLLGTKFDMIFMIVLFRTSTWAFGLQLRHNSSCQGKSRTALSINSPSALPNCLFEGGSIGGLKFNLQKIIWCSQVVGSKEGLTPLLVIRFGWSVKNKPMQLGLQFLRKLVGSVMS